MAFLLLAAVAVVAILAVFYLIKPKRMPTVDIRKFPRKYPKTTDPSIFDVVIVGSGPSGACLGYYLVKKGRKVLTLEKKKFPRDKICGDALCKTGIEILRDMGLYKKLLDENKAHVADAGGLVSPGGLSYVGRSKEILGDIPGAVAIKRMDLDEALAKEAQRVGVDLREEHPVKNVKFDKEKGIWTVTVENSDETFQARVLVCADGAPSRLANELGLVTTPPTGSCSRSYIEGGTHNFKADGVLFYNKKILPGYSALFRHANDEVGLCVYILPGNPEVTDSTLPKWHEFSIKEEPNVSKAIGKKAKMERMKAGPLRCGGEKKTFDDHVLVIGDAAGLIDPMTGEGIHTAMDSGRMAADVLNDAFEVGNFDAAVMEEYQNRWLNSFGLDFYWSEKLCLLSYKYPILLDAATAAMQRKGDKFLARWADIMTGRVPKFHLLHPEFVIVIGFELVRLSLKRVFGFGGGESKKQQ